MLAAVENLLPCFKCVLWQMVLYAFPHSIEHRLVAHWTAQLFLSELLIEVSLLHWVAQDVDTPEVRFTEVHQHAEVELESFAGLLAFAKGAHQLMHIARYVACCVEHFTN